MFAMLAHVHCLATNDFRTQDHITCTYPPVALCEHFISTRELAVQASSFGSCGHYCPARAIGNAEAQTELPSCRLSSNAKAQTGD
ncbi:unannotated protein [freshwater metagenome]|uniref:Unannotated protein n=1 Tax=freshwater metagenome TaxID=449393 RepID=A0A6J6BTY9_9ZZZZ